MLGLRLGLVCVFFIDPRSVLCVGLVLGIASLYARPRIMVSP